ncbi:uncharacterized protein LOC117583698 [Drosophila guanche]|uniref:Blast:Kinetochore-associated protein 1 n=2 Tax=Drosophila guanche TaxID=7266 RepID=A0A3B0K3G9_DROGU|nr:uncharacterized protein LOC117583698 [Drosophila guanche]SPP80519.1 blast:Kinetochore-associated protein 1 [Drosophila guanche]
MWSNFEASPCEDETISNVFSSRGMFRISSEEEVEKYPEVLASVQCGKMVISIDKSLLLLEDELVAKCSFLSFSAQIEAIAISSSGNLIVCGLSDGEVHGVFIKGLLLFSVCVKLDDVGLTGGTFRSIHQCDQRFYFTCKNGSIYGLSEIDEATLESVTNITLNDNETIACEKAILDDVTIKRITKGRPMGNVDCAVLFKQLSAVGHISAQNNQEVRGADHGLIISGDQGTANFKTSANDVTRISLPAHYGSLKQIYNLDDCVIALTNSGHLLDICPYTRTVNLCQSSQGRTLLIEDLLVMECSEESIELLILTKPTDEGRLMKIVEYPSLRCKNEVEVPEHAWLVRQPKCAVNLYYLAAKEANQSSLPSVVEMMLVSETDPSDRFKKLVAKGRLEEAEEFGKQFELCLQPIFEAKAKRILVELCNSDSQLKDPEVDAKFQILLHLLSQIESKAFIKNNRMINLSSRHILERYLREIQKRLSFEEDEEDMLEIDEQLHRLKTLAITDPYECNSDWQKFIYDNNLVRVVKSLFNTDMPTACLIWRRHSSSILPHLNEDELRTLLGFIPSNTKPFNVVQWLRQFIPMVSNTHPSIMPFITDWSIEMTRKLQYNTHWPNIGLEFSTKILEIFEEIQFTYSDVRRQQERNVGKLRDLVNALQDLFVLKTNYNMGFTLDNYMQDSIDATALSILQHVQLDKLQRLVKDFMYPIFQEKGRQPLAVIKQYIAQLVASRQSSSKWLERAMACIELLHNEDSRLECALSVLQNAPVPWPETLGPLIKLRNSTHPLAMKINAEYEIQVIKIMKVKYGWPADSSADINLELFMMRIVKLNLPDMLDDIRTLTKAAPEISTGANFNCCYQMARRGQIELAYEFFKSLGSETNDKHRRDVVEIFANLLENSSTASFVNETKVQEHLNVLELFKLFLPHVESVYERRYLIIKHRFHLREKFSIELSCSGELIPLCRRHELMDEAIERIIERAQATLNVSAFIASEMGELCRTLDLSKVFGLQRLCQRVACLPLSCALAYHVLQFFDCVPANSSDYINLALELIVQQIDSAKGNNQDSPSSLQLINESDPLSFPLAYDLLTSALLHERSRRRDLVELIQYIRVAVIHYPLDAITTHYNGKEQAINEKICRALDGTPMALGETTLNFTSALNGSFDVKPLPQQLQQTTSKKRYSVSMFDEVEVQPAQQPQQKRNISGRLPIVKFLARTLLVMITEAEPTNSMLLQVRQSLAENVKADIDGARADFFLSLEYLTKAKEHDVWYVMSQYLLEYQKQNCKKKRIINEGFISLQLRRIFRNAMNNKDANFIELFSMLVADAEAVAQLDKLSTEVKTDLQKINFLTLSAMYSEHIEDMDNVQIIRAKRLKLYYYLEFCQQDPRIKGKFNADMDNIEHLLKEFHNKQLDVTLLERMSRDFGFDYQKILITQILSILNAQELRFEIKRDTFGDDELVMLSSAQEMQEMCQPYINEIKNVELFTSKLKQFIEEINIYFYELYMCVINILMFFDAAPKEMEIWTNILHFLRHKMITRRRNRPGQLETDMWLKSQRENGVLPKISRYRLPFKPIVEQPLKDILDSELNVDNCQSWFPLIQMYTALKGSKDSNQNCDYFCMSAVKNSIAEYKSKNESESWSLHPTNNAFLKSILRLVKKVHNPNKAFLILYFVSNYARDGADMVEASYECWNFIKENGHLITDAKSQEQVGKVKRRYPIQKTQHLLYVYGLTDEKLLRLVENPTELIHSLYHHELIIKSSKVDINALVTEIANLHDLNLGSIQFRLLQKWLSVTMEPADGTMLEETFLEDQNWSDQHGAGDTSCIGGSSSSDDASENVVRAFYILSSWPKSEAVKFLVGLIFKGGSVNTSTQLQMYECYSKLNDGSNSFTNTISQRQFITIKCVHELKALGYKSNIDKFADDHCNKIDILKMIWQRNAENPLSLEVMANICLGFDIHLPKIWNGILKRMVMFHMLRELNALLDVLSCRPQLLHLDGLALAWDYVLCHPLKNAVQTRSFAQEELLHKTLLRLQGCPVVHALNLVQFAELCILIHRPHMAAALLSFCQSSEHREKIKKLIANRQGDNLRQHILDLEEAGLLPVVLNFALKELKL